MDHKTEGNGHLPGEQPLGPYQGAEINAPLGSAEFEELYGEPLSRALDLSTWNVGLNLDELYGFLGESVVRETTRFEESIKPLIRKHVFPRFTGRKDAPPCAGIYRATLEEVEHAHKGLLFTGGVEAADGTHFAFETVPLTVNQIGVITISYLGDQGTYVHRLYRRDLRASMPPDVDALFDLLDRRMKRGSLSGEGDALSRLARRGIMAYAERAVLLEKSSAPWRMGHGDPAPYELLTGSGSMELLDRGMEVMRELLLGHKKWVFVPSDPAELLLLTLGQALNPLEYAIIDTAHLKMRRIVDAGSYDRRYETKVAGFVNELGPRIARGVYKASSMAPPRIFYAHVDYAHEAALIALADSTMHPHRGFPMLIDLADRIASSTFGAGALASRLEASYAAQGVGFEYLPERATRTV